MPNKKGETKKSDKSIDKSSQNDGATIHCTHFAKSFDWKIAALSNPLYNVIFRSITFSRCVKKQFVNVDNSRSTISVLKLVETI